MVSSLISQANSLQFIDLKDIKPRTEVRGQKFIIANRAPIRHCEERSDVAIQNA